MKTKCMSCGGAAKKMKKGGITQDIVGMPGYNARTDTMKKGGAVKPKIKMMSGGSLKAVPADKVGLAKLPTAVRNKMGYMKKGGVKKK